MTSTTCASPTASSRSCARAEETTPATRCPRTGVRRRGHPRRPPVRRHRLRHRHLARRGSMPRRLSTPRAESGRPALRHLRKPKRLTALQVRALKTLARASRKLIELRLAMRRRLPPAASSDRNAPPSSTAGRRAQPRPEDPTDRDRGQPRDARGPAGRDQDQVVEICSAQRLGGRADDADARAEPRPRLTPTKRTGPSSVRPSPRGAPGSADSAACSSSDAERRGGRAAVGAGRRRRDVLRLPEPDHQLSEVRSYRTSRAS